jgi:PPOX class probable F420-dependent enzyme
MPTAPVPAEVLTFLNRPNPAVIASIRPDGQPVSVATWYLMDADRVLVNMDAGRKRLRYLRSDPRVSLTAIKEGDWYVHVSIQGRVVELRDDEGLADIDRLAMHYTGRSYRNRERPRVSAWIEIDRWHGWKGGRPVRLPELAS